jgi:hypothetical protein
MDSGQNPWIYWHQGKPDRMEKSKTKRNKNTLDIEILQKRLSDPAAIFVL